MVLSTCIAVPGTTCSSSTIVSIRDALLQSAREYESDFSDCKDVKLVKFAYIGHVETVDGRFHVVDTFSILTGMVAPRSHLSGTMFFDSCYNYLDILEHRLGWPHALWCKDGKVCFAVRNHILPTNSGGRINNENTLDLSGGWKHRCMIYIYEYGNSGGIHGPVPTEEARTREMRK